MILRKNSSIDFDLLKISKKSYNSSDEKKFKKEISTFICVKYTDENPTPWNMDYTISDLSGFDYAIDEGYIEKIMPDEFPERFNNYSTEELIRQSQTSINPKTSKEKVIEILMEEGDYSWIVSQKGYEYLNSHPLYDFFATHLMKFDFYEFKLYYDTCAEELSLEEAGDEYVKKKLYKALRKENYEIYFNYLDYYHTLYLKKQKYEKSLEFLAQRIISETNLWTLKKDHVAFDEVYSLESDELIFKFRKLELDLDLDKIFYAAYNHLKLSKLKFDYDKNLDNFKRLMNGENIYDISGEYLEDYFN